MTKGGAQFITLLADAIILVNADKLGSKSIQHTRQLEIKRYTPPERGVTILT